MGHREECSSDNFLPMPLFAPRLQKVAVIGESITLREAAAKVAERNSSREDWDETFMIGDIGVLLKQYKRWQKELPNVEVFYAVKANPLRPVISTLAALGCGFDCASKNEIELVLSCGAKPEKIIYAHPCKMASHLAHAKRSDVRLMTFDSEEELHKVKSVFPSARLVLRIVTDDSAARIQFCDKFGASVEYSKHLITRARELELNVVGISFHAGSGCPSLDSYAKAIEDARTLFDFAREAGFEFKLLDIGGGYPGTEEAESVLSFEAMALTIRTALDKYFPVEDEVRIIAEPGRYIPGPAFGIVTNITSKEVVEDRILYHVGDCIYNRFYLDFVEYLKLVPVPLKLSKNGANFTSSVYSDSHSDSVDLIAGDVEMQEQQVDDWLLWGESGGYTAFIRFGLNGCLMHKACYFISQAEWKELIQASVFPPLLPPTRDFL